MVLSHIILTPEHLQAWSHLFVVGIQCGMIVHHFSRWEALGGVKEGEIPYNRQGPAYVDRPGPEGSRRRHRCSWVLRPSPPPASMPAPGGIADSWPFRWFLSIVLDTACGVRSVLPADTRNRSCAKSGKGGGTMVMWPLHRWASPP